LWEIILVRCGSGHIASGVVATKDLDFSFDLAQVDRESLLGEAGKFIDERKSQLSGESGPVVQTTEGDLIRDLTEDHATLAPTPDVYAITDEAFVNQQRPVPVRLEELSKNFKFFWMRFAVGLMPRRNWAFNRLEIKVAFNPGGDPGTRPKGYQIFPEKKFQDLLKASDHLEVSVDENFEFNAKAAADAGLAKASASASAKAGAGLNIAIGPFNYRIARAKVDNSGTGLDWVFWRLDGKEFFEENRPDFIVIVQVPKEARELKIDAAMQASRFFNFAAANVQDAIKALPAKFASFFKAGAPIADQKKWDLSAKL
jgi:hypothetical protein